MKQGSVLAFWLLYEMVLEFQNALFIFIMDFSKDVITAWFL